MGDTIFPWLLGVLFFLALLTLAVTVQTWREMKRSPYFYLRRQAEKRMQTYSLASLVLLLAATLTARVAWQTPPDNISRVAILVNTKPPKEEIVALVQETTTNSNEVIGSAVPGTLGFVEPGEADESLPTNSLTDLGGTSDSVTQITPSLPEELDEVEPTAELGGDTLIGELLFSTEIDSNFAAIKPRRIFAEGFYTLYASFNYEAMANGMEWSWVWRHNGEVVDGGNEMWNYGENGLGYVYLNPTDGFRNGEYGLEVWVNGDMLSRSTVTMNNAAVSAGN